MALAARFRRHVDAGPTEGAKVALRCLAGRWQALDAEIAELDGLLSELVAEVARAELLDKQGVGQTSPAPCSSPPGTTTNVCAANGPLQRCVARARSTRRQENKSVTD